MKRIVSVSLLAVSSVVLASCGNSGPVTLSLANSQSRSGEVRMVLDEAFTEPAALPIPVTYSVQATLPEFPDRLLAWSIGRRAKPSGEALKLAASFGVTGEVDRVNDNLYVIADNTKKRSISLWIDDAGGWWTYSQDGSASGSSPSRPPCAVGEKCEETPAPTPPVTLITPGEAIRRTNQYLSRADMVPLNYALEGSQSEYSTDVYGALTLGGVQTNIGVSFTYGDNGVVTSASGPMISIAMAGRYPIITAAEAVNRLSDPRYGAIGVAARNAADIAVSSPVPSDASAAPGNSSPQQTPPTTIDIPITSARLILMEARLSNRTHMLLPAYVFSNADGDVGTVLAVSDEKLTFRQSATSTTVVALPEPVAPLPGTPDSSESLSQEEANSLMGLTEEEAQATAGQNGWVVRIAARDGEYFMLTMDYVTNRVNLTIEKTIVTAVTVG